MDIFAAAILGIVQGLTEFLPISSSGHLVVIPQIFGWKGVIDSLEFDVALHLGSTLAVIGFFWKDWLKLFSNFFKALLKKQIFSNEHSRFLIFLALGSIPVALLGFLFNDFFEEEVRHPLVVAYMLIAFGIVLWISDKFAKQVKSLKQVGLLSALVVGTAQALSLIPGVSRSGITVTAARMLQFDRETSVRFSFLLSTPAIIGAGLFTAKDVMEAGLNGSLTVFLVGFVFSAVSGWLAIKLLLYVAKKADFTVFVIYRILFGLLLIIWFLFSS